MSHVRKYKILRDCNGTAVRILFLVPFLLWYPGTVFACLTHPKTLSTCSEHKHSQKLEIILVCLHDARGVEFLSRHLPSACCRYAARDSSTVRERLMTQSYCPAIAQTRGGGGPMRTCKALAHGCSVTANPTEMPPIARASAL